MKIFGVGLNYREHIGELKWGVPASHDEGLEDPVIFTKTDSALLTRGKPFFLPDYTQRCDYETELVVRIGRMGRSISPRFAHGYYDAITVGIDFTARDLQEKLRAKGLPWDLAKGFDGSAGIGEWKTPSFQRKGPDGEDVEIEGGLVRYFGGNTGIDFSLNINGKEVQRGNSNMMIHSVDNLIAYISRFFTLKTGDIIFTGTPIGVGPVHIDDHLEGFMNGEKVLEFNVK